MPTVTERALPLHFEPTEVSAKAIQASLDATRIWADAYVDGLEQVVELQRRLVESYQSAGDQYATAVKDVTNRADEVGTEVLKRLVTSVEEAASKQAEVVRSPAGEPLSGYDSLTAEQVVAKLPGLPQRALAEVEAYERAHQARTTVLTRVESLTGEEPVPGFDELNVGDVQKLLSDGDEQLAGRVREYERAHSARSGVIQAAERQLEQS